jgi:CDP-glucose 4,6-dehydratase
MFTGLTDIYKGKRVFLTGHTGFKGSWLLAWLHLLGAKVKGYALCPETNQDLFNVINGHELCRSVIADINDSTRVKEEILSFKPDFVFHLAAQPLVRLSYEEPIKTFTTNVIGTANVLEAVRELQNPCSVIIITTDKVYENKEWVYPYRETDRLGGHDPYSASKAAAEIIISSYRSSFFNSDNLKVHNKGVAVARAGNVIGGGDWSKDRIIPDIVKAFQSKRNVLVRNPNAVRPWQHVLEPLYGYLLLGAKIAKNPTKFSGAYNFGPFLNDNITVLNLAELACNSWGGNIKIDTLQVDDQPHEAHLLKLDINKTISEIGWRPKYNSIKAIEETIKWYKQIDNVKDFTFSQILAYSTSD